MRTPGCVSIAELKKKSTAASLTGCTQSDHDRHAEWPQAVLQPGPLWTLAMTSAALAEIELGKLGRLDQAIEHLETIRNRASRGRFSWIGIGRCSRNLE
jgi:hypothetical protein